MQKQSFLVLLELAFAEPTEPYYPVLHQLDQCQKNCSLAISHLKVPRMRLHLDGTDAH